MAEFYTRVNSDQYEITFQTRDKEEWQLVQKLCRLIIDVKKMPESYWRLASASVAKDKASWAAHQTGECGRKKTIISVDADEALVISWALDEYLKTHRSR